MTTLRKVAPGDEFDGISAATWNALVDAARHHINPNDTDEAEQVEVNNQYLIDIRNETDELVERFSPLGLDEVVVAPTDDPANPSTIQFISEPVFKGVIPTFDHRSRFAILQESLQPAAAEVLDPVTGDVVTPAYDGMTGRALLYGITPARVDVKNLQHRFAQPKELNAEMQTVSFGGARVLWPPQFVSLGEQWTLLLLTGNGQATAGERISGRLETALTSARTFTAGRRSPETALMQVYAPDPDNSLETQERNRYEILGVTPTDPADPDIVPSFEIETDVRYRLVPHYPIQVVESTSRNGTYRVVSVEWDEGAGRCTIEVEQPIPEVLDPQPPHDPVVDGTILIPGGDDRIPTQRWEIVESLANRAGRANAWCEAQHDGNAFNVTYVDC